MKTQTKALVTWGRHPAHGSQWIRLLDRYSRPENKRRTREGWELAWMPRSHTPNGDPVYA